MLFITQHKIKHKSLTGLRRQLAAEGWRLAHQQGKVSFHLRGDREAAKTQPLATGGGQANIGIVN